MSDEFVFTEEQSSYKVNTIPVEDFVTNLTTHDDFYVELHEDDFIVEADGKNEYQMWQGMVGPYYYPSLDTVGNLSWTNNGGLPNPATVNIQGKGLTIVGLVETTGDLPETSADYDVYLVGATSPYHGYIYANGTWNDLGEIGVGESAGFGTPTATINGGTGIPSVSVTASGPDTAKVFAFSFSNLKGEQGADGRDGTDGVGVPTGGTTGQILKKRSNTDYDTEWASESGAVLSVDGKTGNVTILPSGGASGYVLKKTSATDYDVAWTAESGAVTSVDGKTGDVTVLPSGGNTGDILVKTGATDYAVGWSDGYAHGVIYLTNVPCSAMTGDFASVSNQYITSSHYVAECVFANPSYITSDVSWTTASGNLKLNGTCSSATTCNIVLVGPSDWVAPQSSDIFSLGALLPNNTDLDTVTSPGRYYCGDAASLSNMPSGTYPTGTVIDLVVMPRASSARVWQTLFIYAPNGAHAIWARPMTSATTFGTWYALTNQHYVTTGSAPATVYLPTNSATVIVTGFFQGIGSTTYEISVYGGAVTIKNILTNTAPNSSYLSATFSNNILSIKTYGTSQSRFTAIIGGYVT